MPYVCSLLLISVILLGKSIYKSYINPLSIFLGVFLMGFLLLYSSDFINYDIISWKMKTAYLVSFVCYIIGIIMSQIYSHKNKDHDLGSAIENEDKTYYQQEINILFIIVLIATLIYWAACIRIYGTSGLFSNLLSSKEVDNINGLPIIILYLKMISIFFFLEKKPYYWIVFVFTFLANIAYTRNTIFYIIILDLMVYAYSRPINKTKQSFKWMVYVIIAYIAFRFFSYTQVLFNKEFAVEGTVMGIAINSAILTVVSYFAGPLVSASLYLDQIKDVPFLGYTLRNLFGIFNMFGAGIDTSVYQPDFWVMIPFKFNTAAIQFYILKEGGWIWLVIFFIIIGFLFDWIYWKYKRCYGKTRIMLLSFLSLVLILSVRGYLMNRLDMFIYLIVLLILYFLNNGKVRRIKVVVNRSK